MRRHPAFPVTVLTLFFLGAESCAWNAAGTTGCRPSASPVPLPEALRESSGVAWSRRHPGTLWTHNDGGEGILYALSASGEPLGTMRIPGADLWDWEDLAVGDCPSGSCLYLADTGDNQEVRPQLRMLRVPEPDTPAGEATEAAQVFPFSLPDGPRDIEALFVLPGGEVRFISKGRNHPLTVYRYPPPLRERELVILEEVQILSAGAMSIPAQVTGADATPDGRLVVMRTYEALYFFRMEEGGLVPVEGGRVSLGTLGEPQGEGVGFGPAGEVFLTTESGSFGGVASLRVLECDISFGG